MIIGNFIFDISKNIYTGDIATLTFERRKVELRAIDKSSDKEPDYRILAHAESDFVEIGAAWVRRSEKGQEFLSVSIDDPVLPGPLNAAMFTAADGKSSTLVWTRSKAKKKVA